MRKFSKFLPLLIGALLSMSASSFAETGDGVVFSTSKIERNSKLRSGEAIVTGVTNNCQNRKDELSPRFGICKFGSCGHPTPVDADAHAYTTLLVDLTTEGGTRNVEVGHKTVKNSVKVGPIRTDLPNTYLSYACGSK